MTMPAEFQYDIFLSHSTKDKAVVRLLAERLRADGLKVWFDEWVIKPCDSIPAKIEEGLKHSRVLVLCMSANAFGSDWAQLEYQTYQFPDPLNKKRRLLPLRLDNVGIKGSLAQFMYVDWRPSAREKEYPKLLDACRAPFAKAHEKRLNNVRETPWESGSQKTKPAVSQKRDIDVVCLGEAVIDFSIYGQEWEGFLNQHANSDKPAEIYVSAGGSPFIVAQVIRNKLGGTSEFIGRVGQDPFGNHLYANSHGSLMTQAPNDFRTRVIFSSIKHGSRKFRYISSGAADELLDAKHVQNHGAKLLERCSILHFGGLMLTSPGLRRAADTAVKIASKERCIVSFDVTYREVLWNEDVQKFTKTVARSNAYKKAHILKFTLAELAAFTQFDALSGLVEMVQSIGDKYESPRPEIQEELRRTVGNALNDLVANLVGEKDHKNLCLVVVTCQKYGCVWRTRTGEARYCEAQPAIFGKEVVDSLGAGDSFMARLLLEILIRTKKRHCVLNKEDILRLPESAWGAILELANHEAAKTVRHHGPYLVSRRNPGKRRR